MRCNKAARNRRNSKKADRKPKPTYGIIDSQSGKTVYKGEERGFDVNKKIKGRKRHIVVDTMGNILHVFVHTANNADTSSGIAAAHAACLYYPTLKKFCADAGYIGTFIEDVKLILGIEVDIS